MKKEFLGTLTALLTAFISGFAIIVNKVFIIDLDPVVFTSVRALIIGAVFFIIASFDCKFDYKKFKKVSWSYLIPIGLIGGGMAFLLFFTGLKYTTGGRAAFLHKTLPLYTILFAFFFLKEKITKKLVLAVVLMFIGLIILKSSQIDPAVFWSNPSFGDLLVILATILWAVENTIAKYVMKKEESNFVVVFARMFFGAIFLFGILMFFGNLNALLSLTPIQIVSLFISTLILLNYVLCWYWSIKLINVSKASILLLIAPTITLFLGVIILGEPISSSQLIGSYIILIGAYFAYKIKSEFTQAV